MRRALLLIGAAACFLLAVALFVFVGLPQRADYTGFVVSGGAFVAPEIGYQAPPISATTLTGERVNLADLRGDPVVINFWATWCAPCLAEMPELQTLYEQHQADGLRILAVNMGEGRQVIAAWADELGLTYDLLLDSDQSIAEQYRLRTQPTTFVIAPDGDITRIYHGPVSASQLESVLSSYES